MKDTVSTSQNRLYRNEKSPLKNKSTSQSLNYGRVGHNRTKSSLDGRQNINSPNNIRTKGSNTPGRETKKFGDVIPTKGIDPFNRENDFEKPYRPDMNEFRQTCPPGAFRPDDSFEKAEEILKKNSTYKGPASKKLNSPNNNKNTRSRSNNKGSTRRTLGGNVSKTPNKRELRPRPPSQAFVKKSERKPEIVSPNRSRTPMKPKKVIPKETSSEKRARQEKNEAIKKRKAEKAKKNG